MMKKVVLISVVTIFWLCVLEICMRFLFPFLEIESFNRINYSQVLPQFRNLAPLRHASFVWASIPDNAKFEHKLNMYGFRDADWEVTKSNHKRIAIVGDSFVEGFMSDEHQTIPAIFAKLCKTRKVDVQVMNLGVGAAGIKEYYKLIADFVPLFKPDEVILVLYQNDIVNDLKFDPSWLQSSQEAKHPSRWYPRTVSVCRAIISGEPVARRWHSRPFPFWPVDQNRAIPNFVPERFAEAIRQGGFNENQPYLSISRVNSLKRRLDMTRWHEGLTMLSNFLNKHNVHLSLVYLPANTQVSDYYLAYLAEYSLPGSIPSMMGKKFQFQTAQLANIAAEMKMPWLDLTPFFRIEESKGKHLYWDYDEHLRGDGNEFAAGVLFDWWFSGARGMKNGEATRQRFF